MTAASILPDGLKKDFASQSFDLTTGRYLVRHEEMVSQDSRL